MKSKEFKERLIGKLYSIDVEDDLYGHDTSEADPNDEWSRASTHTDHNITGFKVHPETQYGDVMVPYVPERGVDYYLLYVVYSTGDSFGHDSGSSVEYIGLYTADELHVAKENERRIEAHNSGDHELKLHLLMPNTSVDFNIYVPWQGYFECLDYVSIETVQRMN